MQISACAACAGDAARQHAEAAAAVVARPPDRLDDAGRLPLDHRAGAFGREIARAEAGAAGGDDEPGEAVGQLAQRVGDRLDAVGA